MSMKKDGIRTSALRESGGMQHEVRAAVQHHPVDFRHWRITENLSPTSSTGQCLWSGHYAGGTAYWHTEAGPGQTVRQIFWLRLCR